MSSGASRYFIVAGRFHSFFDPRREHSSILTAYCRRRRAQRRSRTALLQRRRRLVHRLPGASTAVRYRTLFVLSRSGVLLDATGRKCRHRPAPLPGRDPSATALSAACAPVPRSLSSCAREWLPMDEHASLIVLPAELQAMQTPVGSLEKRIMAQHRANEALRRWATRMRDDSWQNKSRSLHWLV